jgi:glycosyltransferase involved in cell wall biosynthesis
MVSVCIPTHNRREALVAILGTIRAQTFQDFEVIVCDDGSRDGTYEYLLAQDWSKLTVLRNAPALRYPGTMARLFSEARGKYIAVAHDHDPLRPEWLERMIALMESHPSAGLGCCACRVLDRFGDMVEDPRLGLWSVFQSQRLLTGDRFVEVLATRVHTPLAVVGSFFVRKVVERAGGYRADWYLASDEDLYRRMARLSDVAFCPEPLFTLAPRPAASGKSMGGWRSIYTLFAFRRDTALRYVRAGVVSRWWCVLRLSAMKWTALLAECVSAWLKGDTEGLYEALRRDIVPPLPDGRPPLGSAERRFLGVLAAGMRLAAPVGLRLGARRGRVQPTAAETL